MADDAVRQRQSSPADLHQMPHHDFASRDPVSNSVGNVFALAQNSLASANSSFLDIDPRADPRSFLLAASNALAAASECMRAAANVYTLDSFAENSSSSTTRPRTSIYGPPRSSLDAPNRSTHSVLSRKRSYALYAGTDDESESDDIDNDNIAAVETSRDRVNNDQTSRAQGPAMPTREPPKNYLAQGLPHEIKEMIYEHFDLEAWKTIRLVCHSWNAIATPELFGQIYLHRCHTRRNDFNVFMRLCTKENLQRHIKCIRLCNGWCDGNRAGCRPIVDMRSSRSGPAPRPDCPRSALQAHDEDHVESDYLSFIRSIDKLHIKSQFVKEDPPPLSSNMREMFFGNLVGLSSLTISHSDLFDLIGHDTPKTDGLLGHVLFPRLQYLHLESTTARMVHLTSLLVPHHSTLRELHLDRLFLESHDWRTFFRELSTRHAGKFRFDKFSMRVGRTKFLQEEALWMPLATSALGEGGIKLSYSAPPKRPYVNGFHWTRRGI